MLKLYRRHLKACKFASKGTSVTKCGCPIWIDGMRDGRRHRYSLDTLNWDEASKKLLEIQAGEDRSEATLPVATKDFLADCRGRHISETTIDKYEQLFNPLLRFCEGQGITTVRGLADLVTLRKFTDAMTDSALTKSKKLERLRTFFRHCEDMGWCDVNPAKKIKKPKLTDPPVLPFSPAEFHAMIEAIEKYPTKNSFGYDNRARLRAFLYVLRYCALRISDCVSLKRSAVKDGRVLIRTHKTGATVHLPLPAVALEALKQIAGDGEYFFWTGNGKLKSAVADWQRSIRRLFVLAKLKGHAHQFRHTLAIELLEKGITVEQVAQILGNSPRIVYMHYSPWIPSRQKALDEAVRSVWGS